MGAITPQSGLSTTVLDFTADLAPLLVGLLVMVLVSASAIAWMAIRHYRAKRTVSVGTARPTPDHQEAA
jgi:hypothetical protein